MTGNSNTDVAGNGITWSSHPAKERLGATAFALAAIASIAWLVAASMHSALWGVFAACVLLIALQRFFLPSTFRVDDAGISAACAWSRRSYRWAEIRRFLYDKRGGYLSTRARGSVFDSFRGIHLIFGANRDAVIARIKGHIETEDASPCSG